MIKWLAPCVMLLALSACQGGGMNRLDAGYSEGRAENEAWFGNFYGTTKAKDNCGFYNTCSDSGDGFYTRGGMSATESSSDSGSYDSGW